MTETCVCAPQWITSGGGCMCWPLTDPTTPFPTPPARHGCETDQPEES